MKYDVYQINFTNKQVNEINESHGNVEYYQLYLNATCFPKKEGVLAAKHLYKKAAEIEAESLENVFEVGNIGPEDQIKRVGPMHSVSVGDVIVDPEGTANFVASIGFVPIEWSV